MTEEARLSLEEGAERGPRGAAMAGLHVAGDLVLTLAREWGASLRREGHGTITGVRARKRVGLVILAAQDLSVAVRRIRRNPAFAAGIVVTLALGIGANASIFAAVDGVLLASLPYPQPERVVVIWPTGGFSREVMDWLREETASFEAVVGMGGQLMILGDGGEPVELFTSEVMGDYPGVVGVSPLLGRSFTAEDGHAGAEPVAILSHRLWIERFGGDRDLLGRRISLEDDGSTYRTVVGVMPADYRAPQGAVDAWVPVTVDRTSGEYGDSYFMEAMGRVREGVALASVNEEIRRFAFRVKERNPGWFDDAQVESARVVALAQDRAAEVRPHLVALSGAVLLVFLIACVNAANLLLARNAATEAELAVRSALGAGRARIASLLLTESLVLGFVAGGAGLAVAYLAQHLLLTALPLPPGTSVAGEKVVLFTLAASVVAALAFGGLPALRAVGTPAGPALYAARGSHATRHEIRLHHVLAASQVALAVLAVFGASVLATRVWATASVDPGFDAEHRVTFRLTAPPGRYPDDASVLAFFRSVRQVLAETPGVRAAGVVSRLPLDLGRSRTSIHPQDYSLPEGQPRPLATHRLVGAGYAETMGFRLREGRFLDRRDEADGPKFALVNRTLAERFWPDGDALGKGLLSSGGGVWLTVAGIVDDVREEDLEGPATAAVYIPHRDWAWRTMHVVVHTEGTSLEFLPTLKRAVWAVDPAVPLSRVRAMEDVVARSYRGLSMTARLFGLFAVLALAVGTVGVYSVMAFTMERRRHELGIRVALGASRSEILRYVLGGAGRTLALGLAAGVAGTPLVGRILGAYVSDLSGSSPAHMVAALALLASVAAAAAYVPARRAAGANPTVSLRAD